MHDSAVANRRENEWKSDLMPQNADAEIDMFKGHGGRGAKIDPVEGRAVFTKCNFAVGASIKIVENSAWEAAAGKMSEIFDVHYFGRSERLMYWTHQFLRKK
jgi:hypothetical protein